LLIRDDILLRNYKTNKGIVYTLHTGDLKPAEKAIESLRKFFQDLDFEVHEHQRNLSKEQMKGFIKLIASKKNEAFDCLIFIVVAHGQIIDGSEQVS
jgi:hypothetical protein